MYDEFDDAVIVPVSASSQYFEERRKSNCVLAVFHDTEVNLGFVCVSYINIRSK